MQKPTFKNKSFTRKQAFTLIELLIVIAIIGILFIVLVSKVDFATDKAKATGVQTDFRSFQMAFDTVAKENAGFNTFGWDTGDANQNGKRDSYDEGDNGAGGGIAQNGIQDGTEVFTGHKVYDETFTKIFSLKKNGTGSYDREALNRLEAAINANLDPKLHITIKDDGEIVMANGAQDPWNKEYHGWYITNAEVDKKDRGAIVMYSDGANNEFGSEHTIANGVVTISIPGSNKAGKDDYGMAVIYTYSNGYGEVKVSTSGFSNNLVHDQNDNNQNINNEPDDESLVNEYGLHYNKVYRCIMTDAPADSFINGFEIVFLNDGTFKMFLINTQAAQNSGLSFPFGIMLGFTSWEAYQASSLTYTMDENGLYMQMDDGVGNIEKNNEPLFYDKNENKFKTEGSDYYFQLTDTSVVLEPYVNQLYQSFDETQIPSITLLENGDWKMSDDTIIPASDMFIHDYVLFKKNNGEYQFVGFTSLDYKSLYLNDFTGNIGADGNTIPTWRID